MRRLFLYIIASGFTVFSVLYAFASLHYSILAEPNFGEKLVAFIRPILGALCIFGLIQLLFNNRLNFSKIIRLALIILSVLLIILYTGELIKTIIAYVKWGESWSFGAYLILQVLSEHFMYPFIGLLIAHLLKPSGSATSGQNHA